MFMAKRVFKFNCVEVVIEAIQIFPRKASNRAYINAHLNEGYLNTTI